MTILLTSNNARTTSRPWQLSPYFAYVRAILLTEAPSPSLLHPNSSSAQLPSLLRIWLLWRHVTMTSHSSPVYCWGFCDVFTAPIKTGARTQGPLGMKRIKNEAALPCSYVIKPTGGALKRGTTPFFPPRCLSPFTAPSSAMTIRHFQGWDVCLPLVDFSSIPCLSWQPFKSRISTNYFSVPTPVF